MTHPGQRFHEKFSLAKTVDCSGCCGVRKNEKEKRALEKDQDLSAQALPKRAVERKNQIELG